MRNLKQRGDLLRDLPWLSPQQALACADGEIVKVHGLAQPLDPSLRTPRSDRPCALWRVQITEEVPLNWKEATTLALIDGIISGGSTAEAGTTRSAGRRGDNEKTVVRATYVGPDRFSLTGDGAITMLVDPDGGMHHLTNFRTVDVTEVDLHADAAPTRKLGPWRWTKGAHFTLHEAAISPDAHAVALGTLITLDDGSRAVDCLPEHGPHFASAGGPIWMDDQIRQAGGLARFLI